ncbi:MAG: shikimate kinase [Candidatus Wallbacteria bacterium]
MGLINSDTAAKFFEKSAITLTGFMACGKTTTGKLLSGELNCDFIDLDEFIENAVSQKITEIFERFGESRFREIEKENLIKVFKTEKGSGKKLVLSAGGGTILDDYNLKLIKRKSLLIYLEVSFETVKSRIGAKNEYDRRPLLKCGEDGLKKLFDSRLDYYEKADLKINCDNLSSIEIIEHIKKIVKF